MNEHPTTTPPTFRHVPAMQIVVLSCRPGECRVMTPAGVGTAATMRDAILATQKVHQ